MKKADVCLIVEGAYPYVTGGVASWCHRLITWFEKEYSFHLVALTADTKTDKDMKYPLPSNVFSFISYNICDYSIFKQTKPQKKIDIEDLKLLQKLMIKGFYHKFTEKEINLFRKILNTGEKFFKSILVSEKGFEFLSQIYAKKRPMAGFTKYFYNWRNIHLLMWKVFLLLRDIPPARVYHAPSTGFAGFLACMAGLMRKAKSIITEHGIYVQEREIEIEDSIWLDETYLRQMWIDFFKALVFWEYNTVDYLITLYQDNVRLQIAYGAPPQKPIVVPNGIQIERFIPARRKRLTTNSPIIGLVARIEPIKDIKTFIQAVKIISQKFPSLKAYIVGPVDDEDYYQECLNLIRILELQNTIIFTGPADVVEYYKKFDVLLLTSIKEAMPLVVLEGMASGLPIVATRVGACEELIYGANDNLGWAGFIASPCIPHDIAEKTLKILKNPELANKMAETGIKRVEKYYREESVKEFYFNCYK